MESGEKMKSDATAMTMHSMQRKTIPPKTIPIHAMGLPVSFRLRICTRETAPNIRARKPNRKLIGKQRTLVSGKSAQPEQNVSRVRIPNTRLRIA